MQSGPSSPGATAGEEQGRRWPSGHTGTAKGPGRRKGAAGARSPRKREWIKKIRAIRKTLADLRDTDEINPHLYRTLYRQAAGGQFRSVAHLKAHLALISGRMK